MKIIEAINSIISHSDKISNVSKNDTEYYFVFNNKYKWSILRTDDGKYNVFLYPKNDKSIDELAAMDALDFTRYTDFISYKSEDIKTKEADETFAELYQIVASKVLGVDEILDDIINFE